jgi:hypothetical protein
MLKGNVSEKLEERELRISLHEKNFMKIERNGAIILSVENRHL